MTATANEEYLAELGQVPAGNVAAYLTNSGWNAEDQLGNSTLWALADGEDDYEVVVPRDRDARDYVLRMINLLQVLADAEHRPRAQILRDLTTVNVDRNYIHAHPLTPPGTISVADGLAAIDGVRELLIAGAYALVAEPTLVLPRRKPHQVEEFPKQARLGPSIAGSYIISVEVPLEDDEGALFSVQQPFGRRVLLRLYDAIRTANSAASEALEVSELSPFADRIGEGVSTNLCRALARFGGGDQDRPFEMRFSWALSMPTGVQTPPIRFDEDQVTVLAQAEEDLGAEENTERSAVVTGTIWRTERIRPTEPGWVVIRGVAMTDGKQRRRLVWLQLAPDDFSVALQALDQGWSVRATGVLVRTGQRTELRAVEMFTVVDR